MSDCMYKIKCVCVSECEREMSRRVSVKECM